MTISTKQLEVFIAVMECGTVTGAAQRLCLSQPSVSRSLERFQHEAGFKVFEKRGNRLAVTDSGAAFFNEVKHYYQGLEKINQVARDLASNRSGHIKMGIFAGWSTAWIVSYIDRHFHSREKIKLSIETRDSRTLVELVISQSLNFSITLINSSHTGVNCQLLYVEKAVCIIPQNHPFTQHTSIAVEQFEGENLISFEQADSFQIKISAALSHVQNINRRITTSLAASSCHLVAKGMGIAIIPETFAQEYAHLGYQIKPLLTEITLPIYLITPKHAITSNIVDDFLADLSKTTNPKPPTSP